MLSIKLINIKLILVLIMDNIENEFLLLVSLNNITNKNNKVKPF